MSMLNRRRYAQVKKERSQTKAAQEAISEFLEDPYDWLETYDDYEREVSWANCTCDMCCPDIYDRLQFLARGSTTFTIAERFLSRVGLTIKQV